VLRGPVGVEFTAVAELDQQLRATVRASGAPGLLRK
jgi:hypothetical protein